MVSDARHCPSHNLTHGSYRYNDTDDDGDNNNHDDNATAAAGMSPRVVNALICGNIYIITCIILYRIEPTISNWCVLCTVHKHILYLPPTPEIWSFLLLAVVLFLYNYTSPRIIYYNVHTMSEHESRTHAEEYSTTLAHTTVHCLSMQYVL